LPPQETETTEPRKVGTVQYMCTVNTFVYLSPSTSLYTHAQSKRETEKDTAVEPRRDKRGKVGKESQLDVARFISIATVKHVA